ncbi:MAG: tetratricopeptide repeat protein, partial [bacterium]|nr:tetratricopeptide repeat protein [bacterium]
KEIFQKLFQENKLTKKDLLDFQKDQIKEILLDFLSVNMGKFKFLKTKTDLSQEYPTSFKIGIQDLLMGSIDRIDKVEKHEKVILENNIYVIKNPLSDQEKPAIYYEILKLIDGENSVMDIFTKSKRSKFVVYTIINELLQLGVIEFNKEKDEEDEFKTEITEILKVDPNKIDSKSFQLGVKLYNDKLYKQAIEEFEKAIKVFPEDLSIYKYLGLTYYKLNEKQKALDTFNQAINISPNDTGTLLGLAKIYVKEHNFEMAESLLTKVISIKPDLGAAIIELANTKYLQKDFANAIRFYNNALKVDPGSIEVYNKLAGIYLKKNQKAEAIVCWKKVLEIDANNQLAKRNLEILGKL